VDTTFDVVAAAPDDAGNAVRFRRGWFLGDGTGCGKGRQVAGIILDNWLKGRRRALWISKSEALIEDARRDWSALGQERLLIQPLARFRQGTPIRLDEGILFVTYATLRSAEREGKASRLDQILAWLGRAPGSERPPTPGSGAGAGFDGVIVFDESHAMQNAAGGKTERGEEVPSQQGRVGLRLQHALPDARIVYVSATGATTVHNLAYAQRLGLWGGADLPFATRAEFVEAIEAGGVAAMEVLARDLKSLGLYTARSLSYEGVEYELVEHAITPEQKRIYDSYSVAFEVLWAAAHNTSNREVAIMRRSLRSQVFLRIGAVLAADYYLDCEPRRPSNRLRRRHVEVARRADRRALEIAHGAELQSGGRGQPSALRPRLSGLSGCARHARGDGNAVAGRAVFLPCGSAFSCALWPISQPALG
jgi:hypothetical protein